MVPLEGAGMLRRSRCSQVGEARVPAAMLMKNEALRGAASSFAFFKPGNPSGGNKTQRRGRTRTRKVGGSGILAGKKKKKKENPALIGGEKS